jgi:hypothetical protein
MAQSATILAPIREVTSLNLVKDTEYRKLFRGLRQILLENLKIFALKKRQHILSALLLFKYDWKAHN